jgi:hypothetical protein
MSAGGVGDTGRRFSSDGRRPPVGGTKLGKAGSPYRRSGYRFEAIDGQVFPTATAQGPARRREPLRVAPPLPPATPDRRARRTYDAAPAPRRSPCRPKLGSRPDPNPRRGRDEGQHLAWPSWPASPAPIGPPLLRRRGHGRAASRGATQLAAPSSRRSPSLSRHWRGLRTRSPRRRHATTDSAMRPPRVYPRRIRGAGRGEPGPVRTDRRSSILPDLDELRLLV